MSIVKLRRQRKNQDGSYDTIHEETSADIIVGLLDRIYPVGSVYISVNNADPSLLFGGTWEVFGSGRTLVGLDTNDSSFDTSEKTGGHKDTQQHTHIQNSHNHTQNAHTHGIRYKALTAVDGSYVCLRRTDGGDSYDGTDSDAANATTATNNAATAVNQTYGTGNSGNLPPYIVVFMWKRIE